MREPLRFTALTGYRLSAQDGEIGHVEDVYFDDQRWRVRYFVVRTGNWLLGRRVLISPVAVTGVDQDEGTLAVELTLEQIRNSPPSQSELPVSHHWEKEYFRYYDWEPYWVGDPMFGSLPYAPPAGAGSKVDEPENPHLRSCREVRSYQLRARDGEIGHVADLMLEQPDWSIRYLEVDTGTWLPGKHVLVAPAWIEHIDWAGREVAVDLQRATIESAPPYDRETLISRDYELALHAHYGREPDDET